MTLNPPLPISNETSRFISAARIVCIFFVIYSHTYIGTPTSIGEHWGLDVLKIIFIDGLSRVSVSLLSAISGFLAVSTAMKTSYHQCLKQKFLNLIIPTWFWCVLLIMTYLAYAHLSNDQEFLQEKLPSTFWGYINAITGISTYPIVEPLHFLRDLFLCFIMLPVIMQVCRKVPKTTLSVALFIAAGGDNMFGLVSFSMVPIFFRPPILALFIIGVMARLQLIPSQKRLLGFIQNQCILIGCGLLLVANTIVLKQFITSYDLRELFLDVSRLLGLVVFFNATIFVAFQVKPDRLSFVSQKMFFVFGRHVWITYLLAQVVGTLYNWETPYLVASMFFFISPLICFLTIVPHELMLKTPLKSLTLIISGQYKKTSPDIRGPKCAE